MEVREARTGYLAKPAFKQTEVGEIPEDWEVQSLASMTDQTRPISYGIVQTGPSIHGGVRCLRVVDIDDGHIDSSNLITTSEAISSTYRRTVLRTGDIVMPLRGNVGDAALIRSDLAGCNLTRGVALIALSSEFSASYCRQFVSSATARGRLLQSMNGSALQEISIATLRGFQIAFPPSPVEQQAIADALGDADALIESLEHLLAKKRQIKQGTMQALLTGQQRLPGFNGAWREGNLGDVVGDLVSGVSVNSDEGEPSADTPSVLKTSAMLGGQFFAAESKPIVRSEWHRARTSLVADTILVSRMNTPDLVGEIGYVPQDYPTIFLPDRIWMTRFRTDTKVCVRWLCYLLSTREAKGRIQGKATGTSGSMKNISKDAFLSLTVAFPSAEEQTAIATVLADMDAEIAALEAKLAKARALKQGMMQTLLTGRIRLV